MGRSIQDMIDAGEVSTFNPETGIYSGRKDQSNKARESPIVWTYSILINHKIELAKQEVKRQQELLNLEIFKEHLAKFLNKDDELFSHVMLTQAIQASYFTITLTYENNTFMVE